MMRALIVLALTIAGCMRSMAPMDRAANAPFPRSDVGYEGPASAALSATDLQRLDAQLATAIRSGAVSIDPADFDRQFRTGGHNYKYTGDLEGVNRARYPTSSHPNAAYSYVMIGVRFELTGDRGAAARAYWGALGLSSRSFASRKQREQIRQLAYAGLARVATRKHQLEWAALLRMCSELAATYARSEHADELHDAFYAELNSQIRVQQRVDDERARARRGMILRSLTAGVSVATSVAGGAAGVTDVNTMTQQLGTQMMTVAEISRDAQQLDEATRQAMSEIAASVGALREVSARDVPELEAGKEFVARQVAWYVVGAADPLPYIDGPLATYGARRPPVAAAVRAVRDAVGAASAEARRAEAAKAVEPLVKILVEAERHVASFERFGIVPGPRYLTSVCTPGAGHAFACHLAATEVCRAGVSDGCAVLATLYSSGGDQ